MNKIDKLELRDSTNYVAWVEGAMELPDSIDAHTKQALMIIQEKINEIIDSLTSKKV